MKTEGTGTNIWGHSTSQVLGEGWCLRSKALPRSWSSCTGRVCTRTHSEQAPKPADKMGPFPSAFVEDRGRSTNYLLFICIFIALAMCFLDSE